MRERVIGKVLNLVLSIHARDLIGIHLNDLNYYFGTKKKKRKASPTGFEPAHPKAWPNS